MVGETTEIMASLAQTKADQQIIIYKFFVIQIADILTDFPDVFLSTRQALVIFNPKINIQKKENLWEYVNVLFIEERAPLNSVL